MRRSSFTQRSIRSLRPWIGVLLLLLTLSCNMPNRVGELFRTPTPTRTITPSPSPSVTASLTPSLTPSLTASLTPTFTGTPTPPTPTATASYTPLPPSLTPAPNQMTAGQEMWELISIETPNTISAIGRVFYPPTRRDPLLSYVYLRLNFRCASGDSLIHLYTGQDMGLTFIYQPYGYNDVYIQDYQGNQYLVNLMGACWLAAPIPRTRLEQGNFTLHFRSLPPFRIRLDTDPVPMRPLLYVSEADLNPELYLLDPIAMTSTRLTNHPSGDIQPAWSVDASQIVFASDLFGSRDIFRMQANGEGLVNLTNHPADDRAPSWNGAFNSIAFQTYRDGNWEIYTISSDGSNPRNLSQNAEADEMPAWSPDGRQIAFQSHRDGNYELYLMTADGSGLRRLTNHPADDLAPVWSPDGSQLLFWSQRQGGWGLYFLDLGGGEPRPLMQYLNPGPQPSRPAWSPDGRYIIFATQRDGNLELYRVTVDGAEVVRLTKNSSDDYDPSW